MQTLDVELVEGLKFGGLGSPCRSEAGGISICLLKSYVWGGQFLSANATPAVCFGQSAEFGKGFHFFYEGNSVDESKANCRLGFQTPLPLIWHPESVWL